MFEYAGKAVLAPMVRVGELPTRLLALKYGADLVWSPEIVDKKIISCQRVENEAIGCVDFVETESTNANKVAFRTCPSLEKGRIVFQLGTANPDLAVQAATAVAKDVAAIDVNAGCPMHFSIHSGMGAALLRTPDKLVDILKALVSQVGQKFSIPISVKIRLLDDKDPKPTCDLVSRLIATGIQHLTVHCRTIPMRPREPALRFALKSIVDLCHEAGVTCYVNGDVNQGNELDELRKIYGVDGVMLARAAEANPSVFRPDGPLPWPIVAQEYAQLAKQYDNHHVNTKYCLSRMIPGKHEVYQSVARSKSTDAIIEALSGLTAEDAKVKNKRKNRTKSVSSDSAPHDKRQIEEAEQPLEIEVKRQKVQVA
uniref:ARAD1C23958p n=1 Tax=Blastobotrys adeninivorans TaxID=409370 RepID=A0A060T1D9_BLAAD